MHNLRTRITQIFTKSYWTKEKEVQTRHFELELLYQEHEIKALFCYMEKGDKYYY